MIPQHNHQNIFDALVVNETRHKHCKRQRQKNSVDDLSPKNLTEKKAEHNGQLRHSQTNQKKSALKFWRCDIRNCFFGHG